MGSGPEASEEGFLSKSDATKSSMNEYDKFIIASVNRGKHGNGPDALAHHNNPAEHGPAVEDKPALYQTPQEKNSMAFTILGMQCMHASHSMPC